MNAYRTWIEQTRAYRTLVADKQGRGLHHCYLCITDDTVALQALLQMAAQLIVCRNGGCGTCADCQRVEHNNHAAISVCSDTKTDAVRAWMETSYYAPSEGNVRVMILPALDAVEAKTQNILLKTLEEPTPRVIFLLGAKQAGAVLDTVKSRAKKLWMPPFDASVLTEILAEQGIRGTQAQHIVACSGGSITHALALAGDTQFAGYYGIVVDILTQMQTSRQVVDMLARLQPDETSLTCCLDIIEMLMHGILRAHASKRAMSEEVRTLAEVYDLATVVNVLGLVTQSRRKLLRHCKVEAIADSLLMGILEVKYQCRSL